MLTTNMTNTSMTYVMKEVWLVWAEIPYISTHMPNGRENTISQMKELVAQNYNHPSIVVWGLSNEITMSWRI